MQKIKTIFERDWEGNHGVIDKYILPNLASKLLTMIPTEKLDGMNVRVTVRNWTVVRLEKRRNPTAEQKHHGICDPWYVDTDKNSREDAHLYTALANTSVKYMPDGCWIAEAVGPSIQSNPLKLNRPVLVFVMNPFYSHLWTVPTYMANVPVSFKAIKKYLSTQKSLYGNDCGIEGIVWHHPDGHEYYKIKAKDFK